MEEIYTLTDAFMETSVHHETNRDGRRPLWRLLTSWQTESRELDWSQSQGIELKGLVLVMDFC